MPGLKPPAKPLYNHSTIIAISGRKLWDKIQGIQIDKVASDYWSAYEDFVSPEKHLQTKRKTYTAEGYNARIRHYLARFHRRTKCYSKSEEMINLSVKLLCLKLNKQISIRN
ncbi:MAG: hypothetical protein LBT89_04805 [Planctomycetaceae bacterium]|nr:hypothetical protein [Planctomycetaceae bacterium]